MLAFGVIPLWDIRLVQSNATVFPLALAWTGESRDTLTQCIPDLKEQVKKLTDEGLTVFRDSSVLPLKYKVKIDVAADLSSLWKLSGVGSGSSNKSCPFCNQSKQGREVIGAATCNLGDKSNWRTDLDLIFGVSMEDVHICTLHAHTRLTEKLLKLLACKSINHSTNGNLSKSQLNVQLKAAKASLATVVQAIATIKQNKVHPTPLPHPHTHTRIHYYPPPIHT